MAVDASAVEIVIRVTDANSGAVIASLSGNLDKLGAAGAGAAAKVSSVGNEFTQLGRVGPPPLRWSSQAMQELGGHTQTSLDKVRLLRQELGIHVPRAMESLIARNEMLMNGISKLGGLMAGIGFGSIAVAFGEMAIHGLEAVWNHYQGVTKAAQDYAAEVEKTRNEEFGNTRSIETTRLRIDEAADSVKNFNQQAQDAQKASFGWRTAVGDLIAPGAGPLLQSWHNQGQANDLAAQAAEKRKQADRLNQLTEGAQWHEQRDQDFGLSAASNDARIARLPQAAQAKARHDAQIQEAADRAAEDRRYANEQDRILGNPVASNAGADKEKITNATARAKADAELFAAEKAQAQELRRIHQEALESGLHGTALYRAQEAAAIDDLKQRGLATAQAVNDVHQKFHNEEMKRLQEENREVARMREETQLGGLTGIARIQQEGKNKISDIYRNDAGLNPGQMLAEVKAVNDQTAQQIAQLNESFKNRVDEIVGQNANRELQGFARIRAEAQNQIRALDQEFHEKGGSPADLARGTAAINQGAAGQAADLARRNEEETEQIESQSRAKFLDAEKQKTAAVESEYEQRLQKYKEELDAQEISQDDYNRRAAAAAQEMNAELVQAATEARQKMASEFDSFFKGMDHPLQYFRSVGDKVAGQAAAAVVQRLQQHGSAGTGQGGGAGTFLGGIIGGFGLGGRMPHGTASVSIPGAAGGPHASVLSVSSATIYVGSAMISGGGSGGGSGGASVGAPGSTPFHAAGGSGFTGGFGSSGTSSYGGASSWSSSAGSSGGASGFSLPTATGGRGGSAIGNVSQGFGLFNQARSIFSPGTGSSSSGGLAETTSVDLGGQFDKNGNWNPTKNSNGGMLGGGGFGANVAGVGSGALGLYSAYEGNGGVGGALSGAMSGMQLGMALGGPIGAGIGAAAGAIVGAIGMGGREKARVYDLKTIRPQIAGDTQSYQQGAMDYLSAYSDLESLQSSAAKTTDKMGPAAQSYYQDTIKPELKEAMGKLTSEQRAGRSMYTASMASYDVGTSYVPEDQIAQVHKGEGIFTADHNERLTSAFERATSMPVQASGQWSGDMHVHAIDAAGVSKFLSDNKHGIRAAVNDSLAENSGGGM